MPNLENLRKQAKQYLRWHRDGYHPVAAEIRAALPRFRRMSDAQVLAARFRLSDAQELVARRLGFESWTALKAGAAAMTTDRHDAPSRAVLRSTEAQVYVADLERSCDFFTARLGFARGFVHGDPPFYGQVTRDGARLNLRLVREPVFAGDIRRRETLLSASFTVATAAEIKRLFLECRAAGVDLHQPLRTEPWGARTFIVQDPDGNLLLFAGPASDPAAPDEPDGPDEPAP